MTKQMLWRIEHLSERYGTRTKHYVKDGRALCDESKVLVSSHTQRALNSTGRGGMVCSDCAARGRELAAQQGGPDV